MSVIKPADENPRAYGENKQFFSVDQEMFVKLWNLINKWECLIRKTQEEGKITMIPHFFNRNVLLFNNRAEVDNIVLKELENLCKTIEYLKEDIFQLTLDEHLTLKSSENGVFQVAT